MLRFYIHIRIYSVFSIHYDLMGIENERENQNRFDERTR